MTTSIPGQVQHLNLAGLPQKPAYTNVIAVTGQVQTIYIGGQEALDATGTIVGKGDLKRQTEQVFHNLQVALQAAGVGLEHIVNQLICFILFL